MSAYPEEKAHATGHSLEPDAPLPCLGGCLDHGRCAGPFELRAFLAEDGTSALYVGVCHHGAAATNMAADVILAGAKKGALDNVKGRLGTERKITFGIYPGLEFDAVNDMFRFHTRICMVGTTMCQTLTAEPLTQPYAFVNRFLDSFQLIARTQP